MVGEEEETADGVCQVRSSQASTHTARQHSTTSTRSSARPLIKPVGTTSTRSSARPLIEPVGQGTITSEKKKGQCTVGSP